MTGPLVSICVPSIGRTTYLPETLRSIESQTLRDFEILILDNASPPDAAAAFQAYARTMPGVRVIRAEQRLPMFSNFNVGLREARGEFVTFFHDDDVYAPAFLERMVGHFSRHPRAGFGGSNCHIIDETGTVVGTRRLIRNPGIQPGREFMLNLLGSGRGPFSTPGAVFRREALLRRPFDESISVHFGDFVVFLRLAEDWDVALDDEPLMSWRYHAGNASRIPHSTSLPLRTRLLQEWLGAYASAHPEEGALVRRLSRRLTRGNVIGLVWGWLAARTDEESRLCLESLRDSPGGGVVAPLLRVFDGLGLTARRRAALIPATRRLGQRIG